VDRRSCSVASIKVDMGLRSIGPAGKSGGVTREGMIHTDGAG
jgi:hypothetical protein